MKEHPNDEKVYYKVRDEMPVNTPLDYAKRFYYQRKTCFRGMLRYNKKGKFNIPFGRYKTYNYEILKNKNSITGQYLSNSIAIIEYLFKKYDNSDNFMFLDPPYDSVYTFKNIHSIFPSILAKLCKEYKVQQFIHLSSALILFYLATLL